MEGSSEGGFKGMGSSEEAVKVDGVVRRRIQVCRVVRVGHHDEWEGDLM